MQHVIKLRLKNERALTGSLKHEEVLSHRLIYFFSTAMLVQKIAIKGTNSIYPSHMKKTPSVLMYIEFKIVTVSVAYLGIFLGVGRGSTNSIEDREQIEWESVGSSPLVRGSAQFAKG
jgi:hypothetical protein